MQNQPIFDTSALTVTPAAAEKIMEILSEEVESSNLRVFVQGGGCAGFSYGFMLDNVINEDDAIHRFGEFCLVVDSMSLQYLQGSEITYKDDIMGSNFVISNPNAETTCGCGSSFSI